MREATALDFADFVKSNSFPSRIDVEPPTRPEHQRLGERQHGILQSAPKDSICGVPPERRIRNIIERRGVMPEPDQMVRFGLFRFDVIRGQLFRGDNIVHLTAGEAGLLSSLAARAGQAVSREDLSQSVQFSGNIRNVDVQVTRLRRKIEPDPRYPRYLQTVRGTGYALRFE